MLLGKFQEVNRKRDNSILLGIGEFGEAGREMAEQETKRTQLAGDLGLQRITDG